MQMKRLFIFTLLIAGMAACGPKQIKNAPAFTFNSVDGKKQSLTDFKGKYVMLLFWNKACRSCIKDFPEIQSLYGQLGGKDFELIAVNVGDKIEASQDFKKKFEVTFPMLGDLQGVTEDLYQLEAFPTNVFVAPDGKIIRTIVGPVIDKNQVEVVINQHKSKG